MVKSKKMSKTGIAVIVLAILLVLSMIMGLTGAWFTSKDSGSIEGGNDTFTLGNFLRLQGGEVDDSEVAFQVQRQMPIESGEHAGELGEYANVEGKIVLPGDKIVVSGSATMTITANLDGEQTARKFWYVISYDNGAHWVDASGNALTTEAAKGDEEFSVTLATTAADAVMSGDLSARMTKNSAEFLVQGLENTNAHKGQTVTITLPDLQIQVRAMQYENVSAEVAYEYLTTGTYADFADPADPAVNP